MAGLDLVVTRAPGGWCGCVWGPKWAGKTTFVRAGGHPAEPGARRDAARRRFIGTLAENLQPRQAVVIGLAVSTRPDSGGAGRMTAGRY